MFCLSAKEMLNVSFRELILNSSIFEKIKPVEFPSVVIMLNEDLENKDIKIIMMQCINSYQKGKSIMRIVIVL